MKTIDQMRVHDLDTGALTYFEHNGERFVRVSRETYERHERQAAIIDCLHTETGKTNKHGKTFARHYKSLRMI